MARSKFQNVGICAMDVYFPSTAVNQADLEKHDNVSQGKYTIGLGQTNMAFCYDQEDINSICLTVVDSLMKKFNIDYNDIGRLEVGTETIIDKSKSVKTCLMQLFAASGNSDVEGVDNTNACYGGTAALLNSIAWIQSNAWDGRYALVVCGDIAVYASGAARPTGGAGAVAMLIGPDAPIIFDDRVRASYFEHVYDFYKPDLNSEYPMVDGRLSIGCYLRAVDQCYTNFARKWHEANGTDFNVNSADYYCFHSPYCKLVLKSFARILYNDFLRNPTDEFFTTVAQYQSTIREETYFNRELEKDFMSLAKGLTKEKVEPTLTLGKELGNVYTASLYCSLLSLLGNKNGQELEGKRAVLFSYGSGLSSTMFSVEFSQPNHPIYTNAKDALNRLAQRTTVSPDEFVSALELREATHNAAPYTPVTKTGNMFMGTFCLREKDEMHRRTYGHV